MNEQLMVLLFILGIIAFILVTDRINQSKLKAQIKKDWGNLPRHLPKDNEESLLKAYESRTKQAEVMIDDLTWDDLNMFEVFKRINLTYSSIGSEKLYQTLREYNLSSENTEKLEILIHYLENNPNEREDISFRFARLGKRDYNYAQIYLNGQTINPLGSHSLYVFLGLLPLIGFLSSFFIGAIGFVVAILALCINTILYLIKKGQLETELAAMNYLVQSLSLSHTLSKKETPIK
ncbi:MAG: DNA mismatch repair protein MutS, partial [Vagococcus sp.]|nr:DNA mismatch repair protein MutS [Vagococcus sp.]